MQGLLKRRGVVLWAKLRKRSHPSHGFSPREGLTFACETTQTASDPHLPHSTAPCVPLLPKSASPLTGKPTYWDSHSCSAGLAQGRSESIVAGEDPA